METIAGQGEHVCCCSWCAPDYFPTGPRANEGHLARRLGDDALMIYRVAEVRLDGARLTRCVEVIPGRQGKVVAAARDGDGRFHSCACGSTGICLEVLEGDVTVMFPLGGIA